MTLLRQGTPRHFVCTNTHGLSYLSPLTPSFLPLLDWKKAKEVLDAKESLQYTVVELDQDPDGKALRAVMGDSLGRTSVPAIWIGGKFIGGCNDGPMGGGLMQLDESGELNTMLREASAM